MSAAKYYIYRNLRTGGFSIRRRGRVVDHLNQHSLTAENVTFKVNEKGRQRVLREKQKNVHAYIVCDVYKLFGREEVDGLNTIIYNPYVVSSFTCGGMPITNARKVICRSGKCYLVKE